MARPLPASRSVASRRVRQPRRSGFFVRLLLAAALAVPVSAGLTMTGVQSTAAAGCIAIQYARFDAPGNDATNLNGEYVVVTNKCSTLIGVGGWRVRDKAGNAYRFASGVRMGKGSIYVHSGKGTNRPGHRYWGRTTPVWNNTGEVAHLLNASGTRVSTWPRVTSTPTPTPTTNPWSTAFGTRPRSGAITLTDCRDRVISNRTFRDLGANVIAIKLVRCHNVTIKAVDFLNVAEGVFAVDSTNIRVIDSRYKNIIGPHERVGLNRANFVQFDHVTGGLIDHNKGIGGDTEDVVSLHASSNVIVEDNHFEGTNWESRSSSGIAIGDGGGSGNIARRNKLVNIGQVGAFIAGGTNNKILDNVIFGAQRPASNVGIYVADFSDGPCSGHTVSGNRVRFRNEDGVLNGYWQGSGCGTVTRSNNDWAAPLVLSSLHVSL